MNTMHSLVLAGQLNDLGDSWINMFKEWATKGLQAGLVCLVVVIMIQKFSLKAGIGALLLMIIALGLYNSRESLANMFEDEVKNPAKGAPVVPGVVQSELPSSRDHSRGVGGRL
ncbi:hypothetical protein AB0900_31980 [Streptomyces cellulosae]|uniref:Uncharacterized protein n=2 Tax=Streptomyces TaxID=1883 RepID=A0ABU3JGH1_9ACTN|nr:hypothetical protein [Streptomyces sp. McG8]MDQ0491291.1 hypothetical protein [Streptomyces thermodiastaticus]MDT6974143.1 hypothetical protein [Streptomyces thermocarboxydus]WSB39359.1 hypothetical protein OG853_00145 [Streptomyces cellulosae]UVT13696.1 hypothetical protein AY578_33410 [Streptomyces thermocarboxydus]